MAFRTKYYTRVVYGGANLYDTEFSTNEKGFSVEKKVDLTNTDLGDPENFKLDNLLKAGVDLRRVNTKIMTIGLDKLIESMGVLPGTQTNNEQTNGVKNA